MFTGSLVKPKDNSGIKLARVLRVYKRQHNIYVGDVLLVSARVVRLRRVKHVITRKKKITKIVKGQKMKALLVFTSHPFKRNGLRLKGNLNSVVIIRKNFFYELVGSRLRTPVFLEVRKFKLAKLFVLAYSVV